MVDHDQKGVKTIGKGKVGDQITGDLLEGAGAGRWNGEKWGSGWMGVNLLLLARDAAVDITANIRSESRPPKLGGHKLTSFENPRVASSGVVMVSSDNGVAEVSIGGYIDAALVS